LGSVLATSKPGQSIAARYDYDVWGNELHNTETSNNPIGYTGHQMDRDIGLIYANARYLDPDTGRFLSFDPFEGYDDKPISLHRYLYAYQSPARFIDPDGRCSTTMEMVAMDECVSATADVLEVDAYTREGADAITEYQQKEAIAGTAALALPLAAFATLESPVAAGSAIVNSVREFGVRGLLSYEAQSGALVLAEEAAGVAVGGLYRPFG
jgi:RHS repeat-associated protein